MKNKTKKIINHLKRFIENFDNDTKRDIAIQDLADEVRINLVNMFMDKNSSSSKKLSKRINGRIVNVRINIKNPNLKGGVKCF